MSRKLNWHEMCMVSLPRETQQCLQLGVWGSHKEGQRCYQDVVQDLRVFCLLIPVAVMHWWCGL